MMRLRTSSLTMKMLRLVNTSGKINSKDKLIPSALKSLDYHLVDCKGLAMALPQLDKISNSLHQLQNPMSEV